MRSLRRGERGLSEIVGTLMLIVIVVAAATALAAFVASYQKAQQNEAAFAHDQSLESLKVLGLTTTVANGAFSNFSFTVASVYINPSHVIGISVDNLPLLSYSWENLSDPGHWFTQELGRSLTLAPDGEILVSTDLDPSSGRNFSFLDPSALPLPNQYVKFDVYTVLENDFTRVFLPPNPLAVVSQTDPSGTNNLTELDGTSSFQPGGNASIVSWNWTAVGGAFGTPSASNLLTSPAGGAFAAPGTISGTGSATFAAPAGYTYGSGESIAFTPGQPTVTGAGCALTGPAPMVTETGESQVGTVLTVGYDFTVTVGGSGCASGTVEIASGGITLTHAGRGPTVLTLAGEEVEASPALPYLTGPALSNDFGFPYLITLTTTDSNGLEDSVTLSFVPPGSYV